jgi:hypothetical protein
MDVAHMIMLLEENNMLMFIPKNEWVSRYDKQWIINVRILGQRIFKFFILIFFFFRLLEN